MNFKHIQHLYWRAGFGLNPKELEKLQNKSKKELVNDLFITSKSATPIKVTSFGDVEMYKNFKMLSSDQKKSLQKLNRTKIVELNVTWVNRLCNPKELLRERMTLFWANHFVCKAQNAFHIQQFNNSTIF